jgi:hypothetical protein
MRHIIFIPIALLMTMFGLASCGTMKGNNDAMKGNKVIVIKEINIRDYSEIRLNVPGNLIYRQTPDSVSYLRISTDENILASLKIKSNRKRLKIKCSKNINPSQLTVYTNSANLNKIKIRGTGNVHLNGTVKSGKMDINLIGKGDIRVDTLHSEETNLKIYGSGNVWMNGTSGHTSFVIIGTGEIHARNYLSQNILCKIYGAGNIEVDAKEKVKSITIGRGNVRAKSGKVNKIDILRF